MAEEFAFEKTLGQRTAVHGNEILFCPRAVIVYRPGDQLLADSTFAEDRDRHINSRHLADAVEHLVHHRRITDNSRKNIFPLHDLSQGVEFGDVLENDDRQSLSLVIERLGRNQESQFTSFFFDLVAELATAAINFGASQRFGNGWSQLAFETLVEASTRLRFDHRPGAPECISGAHIDNGIPGDREFPLQGPVHHANFLILIHDHHRRGDGLEERVQKFALLGQLSMDLPHLAIKFVLTRADLDGDPKVGLVEGFEDITKRADKFDPGQGLIVRERGEENHRDVKAQPDLFGGSDAVDFAAQADVHQYQVRVIFLGKGDRLLGGRGPTGDLVPDPADRVLDILGNDTLVLDHEDALRCH